jgi:hypothetical protein
LPSIVTTGAAERMMAFVTNTPGHCLEYEWKAVGQGNHYLSGGAASARATWDAIPAQYRHVGDRDVPKDMPAFFGVRPSTGNNDGDVIVSFGDGTFAATDYPAGRLGRPTLPQRAAEIQRVYLGWADWQGGYTLSSASWAGGGVTPIPPVPKLEPDMTFSLIPETDGHIYIESQLSGLKAAIQSPQHVQLLQRFKKNDANDTMLAAETDICHAYIQAVNPAPSGGGAPVDVAALAAALAPLLHFPTTIEGTLS